MLTFDKLFVHSSHTHTYTCMYIKLAVGLPGTSSTNFRTHLVI